MPFRWATCVDDEAAHCNSVRPNSTLSSNYSAYGRGHAHGVVIYMSPVLPPKSVGATTDSARRCFTYSKLESLAALGRLYNPARYMFAYTFRLFVLTTTRRAPPTRTASRTTVSA